MKFPKYKQNLSLVDFNGEKYVQSYDTLVAKIDWENRFLIQLGWWSVTTQKHINYVAKDLDLRVTLSKPYPCAVEK